MTKFEDGQSKLESLIPKLEGDDCFIEAIDSGLRISFYDGQVFDVFEVGGWVQVGAVMINDDELDQFAYREELLEFVLGLNSRCLGCRFSLEPDGALLLVEDLPLDRLDEDLINEALDSISFVDFVFYDLVIEVGKSGVAPLEDEIDRIISEKESVGQPFH